jgi:hypothetical protein
MKKCDELELAVKYYESVIRKEDLTKQEKNFWDYKTYVDNLIQENRHYNKPLFKSLMDLRDSKIDKFIENEK